MKIWHISHCYWPAAGRAEKFVQEISEQLARRGHEVDVFTSGGIDLGPQVRFQPPYLPPGEVTIGGVRVKRYSIAQPPKLYEKLYRTLKYLPWLGDHLSLCLHGPVLPDLIPDLKKGRPDLILAAALPMYSVWLGWELARLTKTPLVVAPFYHPSRPEIYRRPLYHLFLRQAAAVLCGSEAERQALIERGIKPQHLHRVGYGIEPSETPHDWTLKWKSRLRLPAEAQVVLFNGRLVPTSGLFTLLRAMPLVWQHFPHTYFVIAGPPSAWSAKLRAKIAALGAKGSQVVVLNSTSEKEKKTFYGLGDVLVSPGREDAWPPAILEGWLAGRPVVACQDGPGRELVQDGQDGCLIRFGSAIDLACAIAKLLKDPGLSQTMGQRGRHKVLASLTWSAAAERVERVYRTVSGKS